MRLRGLISFVILTMLVGLGYLVFSTDQVRAQGSDCELTIEKSVEPQNDTPFGFSLTEPPGAIFFLSVPSNPTEVVNVQIGTPVTVTESVPDGWELDKIECTELPNNCGDTPCLNITINEETNSITAECFDNDEGSCTFFNTENPRNVPTLSQWGLLAMASILGLVGFMVIRRRKVAV